MSDTIIMMDWTRHNEVTDIGGLNYFVWHQIICALLHEDVLAQDETLVMSKNLPKWFANETTFQILQEVFECGGLKVLRRPIEEYPAELYEQVINDPIVARRAHLIKHSVDNDGNNITENYFHDDERNFHNLLDNFLRKHTKAYRFAGTREDSGPTHIFDQFGSQLREILDNRKWDPFIRFLFPGGLNDKVRDAFLEYITDPALALDRIEEFERGKAERFRKDQLRFSTAIAIAVAKTFPEFSIQLQNLIEATFAKPYCQREGAVARVGPKLLWLPEIDDLDGFTGDEIHPQELRVIPGRGIDVPLPKVSKGFAKAVNLVKEKPGVRELREAVAVLDEKQVGGSSEDEFREAAEKVVKCWEPVAEDLAKELSHVGIDSVKVNIKPLFVNTLIGATVGASLDVCFGTPMIITPFAMEIVAGSFTKGIELGRSKGLEFLSRKKYKKHILKTVLPAMQCYRKPPSIRTSERSTTTSGTKPERL